MKWNVMTYNISHCQDFSQTTADDAPVNVDKTVALLKESQADVIALNEVFLKRENEVAGQTEILKESTEYNYGVDAIGQEYSWAIVGNAILSNFTLSDVEKIPVFAPTEEEKRAGENEWYEDRVVLCATLEKDGKKTRIMSTHFGLNGLEQERMIETLCREIDKTEIPLIVLGDFNALPHSDILQPLYQRLRSCADVAGNSEYTFPSFAPNRTLDYIFVSKEFQVRNYSVVKKIASDHLAVQAELTLE